MDVAISPCPNDTFLFYPWIHGLVGQIPIKTTFLDIDHLNKAALEKRFPLMKVSLAQLKNLKDYTLLPVGMALGYGVGPKIIGRPPFKNISDKTVAIPGENTTAHLLFDHFFPGHKKKHFCTYDQILPWLTQKKVDLGIIIHETRFTYAAEGFLEMVDLGELWENTYDLPLPLGGIVLRNDHLDKKENIIETLKECYFYAQQNRSQLEPFILHHAQVKDMAIANKHIDLYVTEETFSLSVKGKKAVDLLLSLTLDIQKDI